MNPQEFVDVIAETVLASSVRGMKKRLEQPAGRNPAKETVKLSTWYNNLNPTDKEMVLEVIAKSARDTTFGFLCVLDGVTAIEHEDKGTLKLYYERRNEKVLLNDQHKVNLHELL